MLGNYLIFLLAVALALAYLAVIHRWLSRSEQKGVDPSASPDHAARPSR
ncbi:MAG: hypothetical protein HYY24_22990 [Verrucomicrobia bacterium]|nr:hypothetical protein [Verrucomicrobiota bacterium]